MGSDAGYANITNTISTNNISGTIVALFTLKICSLLPPKINNKISKNTALKSQIEHALDKDKELELIVLISNDDMNYPKFHNSSYTYIK